MFYYSFEKIGQRLAEIRNAHSDIVALDTIGKSFEQRPIPAVRIAGSADHPPKALFVGGIHGNEKVGVHMVLRLIEVLVSGYRNDQRIRSLVGRREIWLVPLLNPDGYVKSSRRNARGVDLNRNFETAFAERGPLGRLKAWPFYAGPFPYSEPETQSIRSLVEQIDFSVALSFHSFGGLIGYPYGYSRKRPKDFELLKAIAEKMRSRQPFEKYAPRQQSWLYLPRGCLEDEMYEKKGTLAFLIEIMRYARLLTKPSVLPRPFLWFNPTETELPKHLENNVGPALYLLEIASDPRGLLGRNQRA